MKPTGSNKALCTCHSRHFPIPHSWLSSCGKIKIPHSWLRHSWGIFISSRLLSHSWGIWNVPFVIHKEFFFPVFVASPLIQEKSHPYFSPDRDWLISLHFVDASNSSDIASAKIVLWSEGSLSLFLLLPTNCIPW